MQARESLMELQHGSRVQEIDSAKAELDSARAAEQSAVVQLKQARIDQDRYISLFKDKSVSKNSLETYQNLFETAESRVREASARDRGGKTTARTAQGRSAPRADPSELKRH